MSEAAPAGHNLLRNFIERVENLIEERRGITGDIADVMAEAKAHGLEPRIMREIIKLRKMDSAVLKERNALLQTYADALGLDLL